MNLNVEETHFILEKNSVKEDEKGTKLTILEPNTDKTNKRREFLITKSGNVEILKNSIEEKTEETLEEFASRTAYKMEFCKENLLRMKKEKSSITFIVKEDTDLIKKFKVVIPSIIYLNNHGQVLDIINQDREMIESKENHTKKR